MINTYITYVRRVDKYQSTDIKNIFLVFLFLHKQRKFRNGNAKFFQI
jgi:hypothetical protein